jgi:hypothetical protein
LNLGKPGKTLESVARSTGKAVGKAAGNVTREAGKAGHDLVKTVGKAGQDTAATVVKAHSDTFKETERAIENVEELGTAVRRFAVGVVTDRLDNFAEAERRIREGKFADAFWHFNVDPLTDNEERAAKLAQESTIARTAGSVAAAAYGGPGGAAAFSAWYTYRATNDVGLALRAGMISGAASAGLSAVNGMPIEEATAATDIAKRAIVAGAIGGLAVAAAGGDGDALRDGFIRSGGMMLIQDGYREFTGGQDLNANLKSPTNGAFCALSAPSLAGNPSCAPPLDWFKKNPDGSLLMADGHPVLDMSKVDSSYSYLGVATEANKGHWLYSETSATMNGIAKVPGMNAMAIFHDQWVIVAPLDGWTVQATILPAIVVTYLGTEAGIQDQIRDAIQAHKGGAKPLTAEAQPVSPGAIAGGAGESFLCTKSVKQAKKIKAGPMKTSALVVKTMSRSIFVAKGSASTELACVVVYQKDDERADLAPWHAVNDRNYCSSKAAQLAADHVKDGWRCVAR